MVCVQAMLETCEWPSPLGMTPLAQQASLRESVDYTLPELTSMPLTWLPGVRMLWLWLWVHPRPGSEHGVWPALVCQ